MVIQIKRTQIVNKNLRIGKNKKRSQTKRIKRK